MTAPRINIAWLVVGLLACIVLFFMFHIGKAMYNNSSNNSNQEKLIEKETNEALQMENMKYAHDVESQVTTTEYESAVPKPGVAQPMPEVVGQTEEDLRNPDPLQQKAPAYRYNKPQAHDSQAGDPYMEAEYGDNLRHPEAMFEPRVQQQSSYIASSGIGSHNSSPGGNYAIGYASENAQNAGEFMNGVFAFDTSFEGSAYSAL
jgi:hypothetical protein